MTMIRPAAIIFDYGNVLCRPQSLADVETLAAIVKLDIAEFQTRYWRRRLSYDEAALDPRSYWQTVADGQLTEAEIDRLNDIDGKSWTHPAAVMPEWAKNVRASGVRTAILSNMPLTVREALDHSEWLPEFDHRTFSCDVRLAKPAPEIYRYSLRGLGVAARDALFLDDKSENVQAAEALGIHSILFSTPEDLAGQFFGRFDLPPPAVASVGVGQVPDLPRSEEMKDDQNK